MAPFYPCSPSPLRYPDRDLLEHGSTKMGTFPYKTVLLLYVCVIIYIDDHSIIKSLLKGTHPFVFSHDVAFPGTLLRTPVWASRVCLVLRGPRSLRPLYVLPSCNAPMSPPELHCQGEFCDRHPHLCSPRGPARELLLGCGPRSWILEACDMCISDLSLTSLLEITCESCHSPHPR